MRKQSMLTALLVTTLSGSVFAQQPVELPQSIPSPPAPKLLGKDVTVRVWQCTGSNGCAAYCDREEVLVGGGCLNGGQVPGEPIATLFNSTLRESDRRDKARVMYLCAYLGRVTSVFAQAVCIESK
jgi:hypothetical protein